MNDKQYSLGSLAAPMAVEFFFHMMFGITDTFVLSSYNDHAVAAVGYADQIIEIVLLIFRVIASGASILLAQAIGAGDTSEEQHICRTAFWLSIIIGIAASLSVVSVCLPLLKILKLEKNLITYADGYLQMRGTGLIFSSIFTIFTAFYRNYGKAIHTSIIAVFSNILNIVGDILVLEGVIHIFGIVKDVAFVTVIANAIGCISVLFLFLKEKGLFLFQSPSKKHMHSILQLGIPAVGESCSYKCSQMAVTIIIGMLGADILAAKVYGMNIAKIMVLIPNAISVAAGILVGIQIGKKDFYKARSISFSCIKKGAVAVLIVDVLLFLFGKTILMQFTEQKHILKFAYMVIVMEGITMFLKNINLTLGNCLRAAKDVHYPVIISILSMWIIGTWLAWLFGVHIGWGLLGVFLAFFLDEGLRSYLLYRRWMKKNLKIQ